MSEPEERCELCRFWRKSKDKAPLPGWGNCCKEPPKVTYGFPDAFKDWWCGEFRSLDVES